MMTRNKKVYPIWSTVSTELSWAHFQELIKIIRDEKELIELAKENEKIIGEK